MKVYISGKITGKDLKECQDEFKRAESILRVLGYSVVNPLKLPHGAISNWRGYMKTDLVALLDCDAIFMLNDWIESPGARVEFTLAVEAGMKIFFKNSAKSKALIYRVEGKGEKLDPRFGGQIKRFFPDGHFTNEQFSKFLSITKWPTTVSK